MRMRKKKNLRSRMDRCKSVWIRKPETYKGKWKTLMPEAVELHLELGCGKGKFTCEMAALHPDILFIAVERVPDAMVIGMELAVSMDLHNVFFIDGDAAALSKYFVTDEVDLIYINFCDPWPGNKHVRRRLTHPNMLRGYREVLKDNGEIQFKTDNDVLFDWSLFQFLKAGFLLSEVTHDLHQNGIQGVMTGYEEKFHSKGVTINRCVATKEKMTSFSVQQRLSDLLPNWTVQPIQDEDYESVLELLKSDPKFSEIAGNKLTLEALKEDVALLPPNCSPSQKEYIVFSRNKTPSVVLDCVLNYPREDTMFIGLLFVHADLRWLGIGNDIITALFQVASDLGMERLRLACHPDNLDGRAFWKAMGFQDVRMGEDFSSGQPVWLMERHLTRDKQGNFSLTNQI